MRALAARCFAMGLAFGMLASNCRPQAQWAAIGSPAPGAYIDSLVADRSSGRLIALRPGLTTSDVLEYDGQAWVAHPAVMPTMAGFAGMCYDEARRETLIPFRFPYALFVWNGEKAILRSTQLPAQLAIISMAFHRRRGTVMALAGFGQPTTSMVLWEWDGTNWSVVATPQPLPIGAFFENLTYDPTRIRLVAYGPYAPDPIFTSQFAYRPWTFEWDEQTGWEQVSSAGPVLIAPKLVHDEARDVIVMTYPGGSNGAPPQCWERRGKGAWVQKPAPTRWLYSPVYDSQRRRVVAIGGFQASTAYELLAYQPVHPAPFTTFAPGCPGPLGTAAITLSAPHTAAWIGDALQVTVSRLPGAFAGLFLGYSNTTASGTPLPLDLGPVGMPSCSLRVSPDAMWLCSGEGTQCTASIAVPNSTALLDRDVYLQAVVPAPTTNAAGLVVSDAAVARVGSR